LDDSFELILHNECKKDGKNTEVLAIPEIMAIRNSTTQAAVYIKYLLKYLIIKKTFLTQMFL
jgi:hypothetical protein